MFQWQSTIFNTQQRVTQHAEGMSLRDDESQIRDSHPLRFMVCFLGVMWMAGGGKMIWGM